MYQRYEDPPHQAPAAKATKTAWVEHARALAEWADHTHLLVEGQEQAVETRDRRLAQLCEEAELGTGK